MPIWIVVQAFHTQRFPAMDHKVVIGPSANCKPGISDKGMCSAQNFQLLGPYPFGTYNLLIYVINNRIYYHINEVGVWKNNVENTTAFFD